MIEKKDVLDYLRNQQKAAEIEAKVNGINLWVLLGAIGIITWQLLPHLDASLWNHRELALRVILGFEAVYFFSYICTSTNNLRDELRYAAWNQGDISSPLLVLIESFWVLIPPSLFILLIEKSFSVYYLGIFGVMIFAAGATEIAFRLRKEKNIEKFPKPNFRISTRTNHIFDLIFAAGFALVIAEQISAIWHINIGSIETVKALALLATLYLLCIVTIRRRRTMSSTQWTYDLETDILLGTVSLDTALRRIEHRALGPKLEDVMNKFFDDLDKKIDELENCLAESEKQLEPVRKIPKEFPAEINARINEAVANSKPKTIELQADIKEFSTYIENLTKKKSDKRVADVLEGLAVRKRNYADRIQLASEKLDNLMKNTKS